MRTLIDTCVLSEVQRKRGSTQVRARFAAIPDKEVFLSVLTLGELRKGIDKLRTSEKKRSLSAWCNQLVLAAGDRILPIDHDTAVIWGEVTAKCEKKGRSIPAIDGLIAATALRHGLHLMTRNVADFEPTGVMLINPWDSAS